MKQNKQKLDKFMVLFWLFEAQYNVASQLEGQLKQTAKMLFNRLWKESKHLAKHIQEAAQDLEEEKGLEKDEATDDMFDSGEAIVTFCEKYLEAERNGKAALFMGYLKNWK